jgi:transposase InsO family protein
VSKARLVITAVVVEGRSQSEVAREYGVSQGWISRLVARYRLEGEGAFAPRSRRPLTSPTRLPQPTIELIVTLRNDLLSKGLDHGPHTIAWHLRHHHGLTVSVNSIHRHLRAAGLVTPTPQRRPKSSYIRFAAEQPNERWQADFTHWWLADGTHVEILDWIDDHARYALSVTAHRRVTGHIVLAEFRKTVAAHGVPASTLTDNGMVFTTRLAGGKGGRNGFENELHRLGVTQINSTPNHPTTCGKIERFHQTLKKWLTNQPRAATLAELQTQLNTFVEGLQPRPTTPLTAPSGHPGNRLHRPPQSRPRKPHRHPQPSPPRPHRPSRRHHPARRWTPPPHRRRPNLHRHPRTRADPRPPHPHHPRRHRPTPARANPEHHQGLPTHRRTKRPQTEKVPNLTQVRNYPDVLRHHTSSGDRIRTCDLWVMS